MGVETDDPRIVFAVRSIKKALYDLGYVKVNLDRPRYGHTTARAVWRYQRANKLHRDGMVGRSTANALWRPFIEEQEIPRTWLRAQVRWESADDPGAMFTNPDGSRDRGLLQFNSSASDLPGTLAFDAQHAITLGAQRLRKRAQEFGKCEVGRWKLAIAAHRTPVGAEEWCEHPETVPNQDGTWAEKAAYYVSRVDVDGRKGWVG